MLLKFSAKYNKAIKYQIDEKTLEPLYSIYLNDKSLERTFILLTSKMTPLWNSLFYGNIRDFAEQLGQSYSQLSKKLKKLKDLDLITTNRGYLYINPFFATKSRDIYDVTLEHFMQPVTDKDTIARLISEHDDKLDSNSRIFEYKVAKRFLETSPNTRVSRYYVPNKLLSF